jgi:hypothetical protein
VETGVALAQIPYERDIARDLVRRGILAAPFAVAFGALVQGWAGAVGVALGLAVVLFNYLVAGAAQSWAARKDSPGFFGGTVLVSLIFRFVVLVVALTLLRDRSFLDYTSFGIALVVSHLGLLAWEAKSVSLTLAFPGLKRDLKSRVMPGAESAPATPSNALCGKD